MANATIIALAEAVKVSLNAASFSLSFESERRYRPLRELSELEGTTGLKVDVVPSTSESAIAARTRREIDYEIDIGIRKRVEPDVLARVDPLVLLVEQIEDHFYPEEGDPLRIELGGNVSAKTIGSEIAPVFDPDEMNEKGVFFSVLTVTFRLHR